MQYLHWDWTTLHSLLLFTLVCALLFSDSIFYTFSFVKQIYETENQRKGDTSLRDGFGSVISVVTDYTEEEGRSRGSNPLQGQFLANGPLQSQQTISSSKCHLLSISILYLDYPDQDKEFSNCDDLSTFFKIFRVV